MECSVCCDTFDKKTRKEISCEHCLYTACHSCCKRYIRDSYQAPHCMECHKVWSKDFLHTHFTKQFLKGEYRESRQTLLFAQEQTHLPQYQEEADRLTRLDQTDAEIQTLQKEMQDNHANEDQLVKTQRTIHRQLQGSLQTLFRKKYELTVKKARIARPFVMKCPSECKGFLTEQFECGLCHTTFCKECHVSKSEGHACDPNQVATITELKKTTRSCPQCHVSIYKIDGCDQMFCIQCKTAFSWRTGQVEKGVIHNPHYYDLLRREQIPLERQRHQEQGACGPMLTLITLRRLLEGIPFSLKDDLFFFHQRFVHHRNVDLPRYLHAENDIDKDRIDYLCGKLDEPKFKAKLFVRHEKNQRKIEERQILNSYVSIGEELFKSMTLKTITVPFLKELIDQLNTLRDLTFDAVVSMDKKYHHQAYLHPYDIKQI